MKSLFFIIDLTMVLCVCSLLTYAQPIPEKCEATKLARKHAPVNLLLERIELKEAVNGNPSRVALFRLTNNTTCKITLLTPNSHTSFTRILRDENGEPLKNQHGGLRFEYSSDIHHNYLTEIDVFVYSDNPAKGYLIWKEGGGDYRQRFVQNLRSGESVFFQVNEQFLKKRRVLSVNYGYENEKYADGHTATYNFSQPLKEAINQFKKNKAQDASN